MGENALLWSYRGRSALHKDVRYTDPHDSTGQATPTLGAGWPVGGELCLELVGPAAGQALVNQAIKYRHLKQFLVTLRVTLLPTLLMPETKKTHGVGWCYWGRHQRHAPSLQPPSLLPCLHPASSSSSKAPLQVPPSSRALPFPGQEQSGSQPRGRRLCLCQWNALRQSFRGEYLHTALPCAVYVAQICLE